VCLCLYVCVCVCVCVCVFCLALDKISESVPSYTSSIRLTHAPYLGHPRSQARHTPTHLAGQSTRSLRKTRVAGNGTDDARVGPRSTKQACVTRSLIPQDAQEQGPSQGIRRQVSSQLCTPLNSASRATPRHFISSRLSFDTTDSFCMSSNQSRIHRPATHNTHTHTHSRESGYATGVW
jgi:hypothetical protein